MPSVALTYKAFKQLLCKHEEIIAQTVQDLVNSLRQEIIKLTRKGALISNHKDRLKTEKWPI